MARGGSNKNEGAGMGPREDSASQGHEVRPAWWGHRLEAAARGCSHENEGAGMGPWKGSTGWGCGVRSIDWRQ
ncbi:hypothetical protein COCNU_03G003790 [Cocos nucifera]|uniref:Uncharacterized protein n=1 Tax=Cocos nucifera TaxID=13894 RepID=A0A8K0I1S8_COCNU|nr:hypothetical protein COCNU_03G003790 [Cocos nucifera]